MNEAEWNFFKPQSSLIYDNTDCPLLCNDNDPSVNQNIEDFYVPSLSTYIA